MLSKVTMTRIDLAHNRDRLINKTFKVTDIEGSETVYLKDNESNEYALSANKKGKLQLDQFQTSTERIDYLEDLVVTMMEMLGLDEEKAHDLTTKRLYGDS